MYDFRNEIIALAEKTLQAFVKFRLVDLGIENTWKIGLSNFVNNEYKEHSANYEKLYVFLKNHDEQEVTIEQLDITALTALVHFYWKSKGIYEVSEDATQLFINHVQGMRELRNTFDHYVQELTDFDSEKMYYDQLYFSSNIACFAVLVMKYKGKNDEWKLIYHKAKAIETKLRGEHWLAMDSIPDKGLDNEDDISDLIALAEQGHIDAQVKLGKEYYNGIRIKRDLDKAYLWSRKAAINGNPEAQYYYAMCIFGDITDDDATKKFFKWIKISADNGFAAAQVDYVLYSVNNFNVLTNEEKQYYLKYLNKAFEQEYPKAIYTMGMLYMSGSIFNKDVVKANNYVVKAANMGYDIASVYLADQALKTENYDEALKWYKLAEQQGDKSVKNKIRIVERKIKNL